MPRRILLLTPIVFFPVGCATSPEPQPFDPALRARELAREILIVDTHVDLPYRLQDHPADVAERTADGHFDFPRAKEGGLDAPFMSIYVPSSYQTDGGAKALADSLIDGVEAIVAAAPDKFAIARSPGEVRRIAAEGRIAFPLGIENGAAIEDDLANVEHFFARGVRYITLTHSKSNLIGDSSYDPERRWRGLSPFGLEVVREMNRLGVMVDISHVTDETAAAALDASLAPVIASHSSCRAMTPDWERNISDALIRRVAERGGVIQVNFGSAFLTAQAQVASDARWKETERRLAEHGLAWTSPEAREIVEAARREMPVPATSIDDVVAHIDHVVRLVGVEHVGFGSDFDGVDAVPVGLEDVSKYPALIAALLARGYSEEDVRKIAGENLLRVWSAVEAAAGGPLRASLPCWSRQTENRR